MDEVEKTLRCVQPRKAPGPAGRVSGFECYKRIVLMQLAPFLTRVYNQSLVPSVTPATLKQSLNYTTP